MMKPTIFVGLGTTGTDILKILRELMSEEYEKAGLPIFRYISIETKDTETGENRKHFEDFERIQVVNAILEGTTAIRSQLEPNQPSYNPELAKWLNPDLLYEIQSFMDGAGNIRMAGRLCLWHNWEIIRRTLSQARRHIIEDSNKLRTSNILTQHYQAKNLDVPPQLVDDRGINVYVVGTLCGGTCSGMFIDMAYLIRSILGGGNTNEVNGIFTMYDQTSAGSNDDDTATRAANCYASLSELNFYNYTKTFYDVTFPSGTKVNTTQKPFGYELIVSPTGKQSGIQFVSGGKVDEEGLSLMVALNLFAEAAGDTDGHKKEIRTDWQGFGGGYGKLKEVPAGEIRTMVRCLASFGLTAVWYPKYRIASAAACFASKALCTNLKAKHTSDEEIRADVINEWNNIRVNIELLTSPQVEGRPSLKAEIDTDLNNLKNEVLNRKVSAQNLQRMLNSYPEGDAGSYVNRFSNNGIYSAWIKGKVDNCKAAIRTAIDETLHNRLSRVCDSSNSYGINDVYHFFQELDQRIMDTQDKIENKLPSLNLDKLNFEPMRRAERNPWTKAVGKREEAVSSYRQSLLDQYYQLILGDGIGIYQRMRYYFFRQVLEDVRAILGFESGAETNTVRQQLNEIQSNLDLCLKILNKEYNSEIQSPGYVCVKIVANNKENSIQIDADNLGNQIVGGSITDEMRKDGAKTIPKHEFMREEGEFLSQQINETYQRIALNKINTDGQDGAASTLVVTKAQDLLQNDEPKIRNLATRSNPYQQFSEMYQAQKLDRGTKIVFGHDPAGLGLNALKNALDFERTGNSYVDHLLFFYEEEAGFTFDDLEVYASLKHHYENSKPVVGHWTHQNPDFYDLKLQPKSADLKRWCHALNMLVPKIREGHPKAFGSLFEFENGSIIFTYKNRMGIDKELSLSDDTSGIDNLCSVENDSYYNYFFESIKAEFNKLGLQAASNAVNDSLKEIDRSEQDSMSKFFTQYLVEIFPDGVETTNTPPVQEPKVAVTLTDDVSDEEQSGMPKDQGTESIIGALAQIQQLLIKPESELTEKEKALIQLLHQISADTESNEVSTTQEDSTDQSEGVILEEVVSDENNTPDE